MTRAHKGWALDSVVLQNLITRHTKEELNDSPPEGVYVHGLFLEGASLDHRSGKLMESKPKVQQNDWPRFLSAGLKLEALFSLEGYISLFIQVWEIFLVQYSEFIPSNGSSMVSNGVSPEIWQSWTVILLCFWYEKFVSDTN